jgi:predicted polyphosphate/ATP-dependent NAD kinase
MTVGNSTHKIGFIVNPIAGIGGRVGLKGSDGSEIVQEARKRGAEALAPLRGIEALRGLLPLREVIELFTYPEEMGEWEARECNIEPQIIDRKGRGETTADDTRRVAKEMIELSVELILFVGGDGTARNIYEAINGKIPVIGVPAGVKMHSSVFAITPPRAADLVIAYMQGNAPVQSMEVMDIDEDAFREGRLSARLYGYLKVPFERGLVQGIKASVTHTMQKLKEIAEYVVDQMEDNCYYILGPGTTVKAITDELDVRKTLLGVDIVLNKKLVACDVTESDILGLITGKKAAVIVSVIGGQGYILGRGNQQISPSVLKEVGIDNLMVLATPDKLTSLEGPLLIDAGNSEIDKMFSGWIKVITGYHESAMWEVTF